MSGARALIVISKVVCGGETGVDRAALDTAIALDIPYGGWCPKGGWAEDLPNPPGLLAAYPNLKPTPSADPAQRTQWNVRDSDRTLILTGPGGLAASPGTALTVQHAEALGRPHDVASAFNPGAASAITRWLEGAKARARAQYRRAEGERGARHLRCGADCPDRCARRRFATLTALGIPRTTNTMD